MTKVLNILTVYLVMIILSGCARDAEPEGKEQDSLEGDRPNIIYILADDLGYGDIGAYGQQHTMTPNLDRLAAEGVRFTRHYSGSTVCAPSRASLLTGLHTGIQEIRANYELGGYTDEEERGQMPLRAGTETLGTMLQGAGYRTAAIGKWGLGGPGSEGEPNQQGFDHFFGYLDQKQAHNYYPTHLWRNGKSVPLKNSFFIPHTWISGDSERPEDYQNYMGLDYAPDLLTAEAKQFIDDNSAKPFFLYLAYTTPHAALQVPDTELTRYEGLWDEVPLSGEDSGYTPHPKPRAARAGMITHMDEDIGEMINLVTELGIADNTLIIFSSDNGPSRAGGADIHFFDSTAGLRGAKTDLYEGGVRVPMIANWPNVIPAGSETDYVSAFWDVMPTLAELVGVNSPADVGRSFLAALMGQETASEENRNLYWEFHSYWEGVNTGSQAVLLGRRWKAVRPNAKFNPDSPVELYDLERDPNESVNVAGVFPAIVARAVKVMNNRQESEIDIWSFPSAASVGNL